jgi:hypothetical protein
MASPFRTSLICAKFECPLLEILLGDATEEKSLNSQTQVNHSTLDPSRRLKQLT